MASPCCIITFSPVQAPSPNGREAPHLSTSAQTPHTYSCRRPYALKAHVHPHHYPTWPVALAHMPGSCSMGRVLDTTPRRRRLTMPVRFQPSPPTCSDATPGAGSFADGRCDDACAWSSSGSSLSSGTRCQQMPGQRATRRGCRTAQSRQPPCHATQLHYTSWPASAKSLAPNKQITTTISALLAAIDTAAYALWLARLVAVHTTPHL